MERVKSFIDDLISSLKFRNREIKKIIIVRKLDNLKNKKYEIIMENQETPISVEEDLENSKYLLTIVKGNDKIKISDNGNGKVKELFDATSSYWGELLTVELDLESSNKIRIEKDNVKSSESHMQKSLDLIKTIYRKK